MLWKWDSCIWTFLFTPVMSLSLGSSRLIPPHPVLVLVNPTP